jgi:hypothetical protein
MINLFVIHVKRVIIQMKNMKLLNNLKFNMMRKNIFRYNIFHYVINELRLWTQNEFIQFNIDNRWECWYCVYEEEKDEKIC